MTQFRVSRFLKRDIVARVNYVNNKGIVTNARKHFSFYPSGDVSDGGWYDTKDEVLVNSLKELKEQLPYSVAAEQGLKSAGVPYTYAYCPSCGGKKIRKLEYHLFEVV